MKKFRKWMALKTSRDLYRIKKKKHRKKRHIFSFVGGRGGSLSKNNNDKASGVGLREITSSADLGGSSNYSKGIQTQCSTLKTEETKVFLTTVIAQELVDPKLKDYEK